MAAHFTIPDLKQLRSLYQSLGITDSLVLDKVNQIISLNHFNSEEIEELQSIILDYTRSGGEIDQFMNSTVKKVELIESLHERSKQNKIKFQQIQQVA